MQFGSTGLLLVQMDIAPEVEEEFQRWYDEEHLPERLAIPGIQRIRRYRSTAGSPKYLALYDLADIDVLDGPEYRKLKDAGNTPWTTRMLGHSSNFKRLVYHKIYDRCADEKS